VIDGVRVLVDGLRAKLEADELDSWRSTFRRGQIYTDDVGAGGGGSAGAQCRRQPSTAWRHGPDLIRFIKQVRAVRRTHCGYTTWSRRAFSSHSTAPTPTPTSSRRSSRGCRRGCRRVGRLPRSACHRNNFRKSIARVGRVGEDPREDVGVRAGVGVVESQL